MDYRFSSFSFFINRHCPFSVASILILSFVTSSWCSLQIVTQFSFVIFPPCPLDKISCLSKLYLLPHQGTWHFQPSRSNTSRVIGSSIASTSQEYVPLYS